MTRYNRIAEKTTHPIGNSPNAAPYVTDENSIPTGIRYTARASITVAPSPASDAIQAGLRRIPIKKSKTKIGKAATSADKIKLFAIGV